ncbi:MAG TPA: YbaB/EbfC family nucleoid-associated protein [Streptosporangiaceae bacterium]|jgi:DNA-binding protein YbaB|nr:YbaB/EbfC family nucleoid-associated protein [Streptosporangiaceae bacterium]
MDSADVHGAFRDARRELESVRALPAGAPGVGEAADGQVRVVAAKGVIESIELDPRVMRLPSERLTEHLVAAGNAALAEMRARAPAPEPAGIDPAALAERVEQLTGEGLRSMATITQAIEDAMSRVAERTGMTGDPGLQGLEQLVEQTRRSIPAVTGDSADEAPDLAGAGAAAEGRIRARVTPGGRIESLDIDPGVMRFASADVAEQAAAAVNAALDDMRAKSRDRAGAVGNVDLRRLQALREESVRQMSAYSGALRDLIASVYRR